jgi:hypothetical protein
MKKILKVALPSVFFMVFGISVMLVVSGCEEEPGEKCSSCSTSNDCDEDLDCYTFSDGVKRCAESKGDLCTKF